MFVSRYTWNMCVCVTLNTHLIGISIPLGVMGIRLFAKCMTLLASVRRQALCDSKHSKPCPENHPISFPPWLRPAYGRCGKLFKKSCHIPYPWPLLVHLWPLPIITAWDVCGLTCRDSRDSRDSGRMPRRPAGLSLTAPPRGRSIAPEVCAVRRAPCAVHGETCFVLHALHILLKRIETADEHVQNMWSEVAPLHPAALADIQKRPPWRQCGLRATAGHHLTETSKRSKGQDRRTAARGNTGSERKSPTKTANTKVSSPFCRKLAF